MTRNQELRLKQRVKTQRDRIAELEAILEKIRLEGLHGSLMTEIEELLRGGGRMD